MGSHRQTFLHHLPTLMTFLAGETGVHSDDLMTSSFSLIFKDSEECAPRGVEYAFRQMMIFHQISDLKVFDCNHVIALSVLFGDLEMVIPALSVDLQMGFRDVAGRFAASMAPLLTTTKGSLLASESLLRGAIEAGIFDGVAITIGKKDFQADINADIRMFTNRGSMLSQSLSLTDKVLIALFSRKLLELSRG
jgi:hypothetical protein